MKLREHCGVVAVRGKDAVELTYELLKLHQHRGQESAGISAVIDGRLVTVKGLGTVEDALNYEEVRNLESTVAIGHVRYSTTGRTTVEDSQPLSNGSVAVAFNGTITNAYREGYRLDTLFLLDLIASEKDLIAGVRKVFERADGAYSAVALNGSGKLTAFRDPKGFRPLVLGKIGDDLVVASEDGPIRQLGGDVVRDVIPGEVVFLEEDHFAFTSVKPPESATCSFEYIYFARADSTIDGYSVYEARVRLGEMLGRNHRAEADLAVPVPDSSVPIAIGYSRVTGTPLEYALVRSYHSLRSFIMPTHDKRITTIEEKFGVVARAVSGKRVVLIDDSIVRGNTMKRLVSYLRNAGAKEVHVRVGSPPIRYPCYMGIDFPSRRELIAYGRDEGAIAKEIGADSVEYLTVEEMIEAIGRKDLCHACFTGKYPLRLSYKLEELESTFTR
jgi:amidophosphoribosyltransferase (EC 2.4.2.14)